MATPPYNPNIPPPNDPRNDPRWQRAQSKAWQAQARASRDAWKAQARAQKDQWRAYRRSLRRTSLVGPLLLVAIGVVFLLVHSGRVSMPNLASWYAEWWPGLLIVIGLFMFAEWGIARARRASDAPPLRYQLGAGFSFVVALLIIAGIAASEAKEHSFDFSDMKINGEDWDHFAGSKHENDPAPIVRALAAGSILTIDNARGDVAVTGLSDDGQLHLTAHNEVYSQNDDDAQDKLKQLEARIATTGDTMSITIPTIDSGHSDITAQVARRDTDYGECQSWRRACEQHQSERHGHSKSRRHRPEGDHRRSDRAHQSKLFRSGHREYYRTSYGGGSWR